MNFSGMRTYSTARRRMKLPVSSPRYRLEAVFLLGGGQVLRVEENFMGLLLSVVDANISRPLPTYTTTPYTAT